MSLDPSPRSCAAPVGLSASIRRPSRGVTTFGYLRPPEHTPGAPLNARRTQGQDKGSPSIPGEVLTLPVGGWGRWGSQSSPRRTRLPFTTSKAYTESVGCLGAGIIRWYATLKGWTCVAISIAGPSACGMPARSLKLAVQSVTTPAVRTRRKTEIVMNVENRGLLRGRSSCVLPHEVTGGSSRGTR